MCLGRWIWLWLVDWFLLQLDLESKAFSIVVYKLTELYKKIQGTWSHGWPELLVQPGGDDGSFIITPCTSWYVAFSFLHIISAEVKETTAGGSFLWWFRTHKQSFSVRHNWLRFICLLIFNASQINIYNPGCRGRFWSIQMAYVSSKSVRSVPLSHLSSFST